MQEFCVEINVIYHHRRSLGKYGGGEVVEAGVRGEGRNGTKVSTVRIRGEIASPS